MGKVPASAAADPLWRSATVRAFLLYAATALAGWACHLVWSDHEAAGHTFTRLEVISVQLEQIRADVGELKAQRIARGSSGTTPNP